MKARLGCRGVFETRFPSLWLSLTQDKLKVEATKNKESESTLFYLIPTGMREVCIQHIASRNFIAINHNGKLISKASEKLVQSDQGSAGRHRPVVPKIFRNRFWLPSSKKSEKFAEKSIYDADCNFKEGIFTNYWTTYSSLKWGLDRMQLSTWFMAINGRGHRVSAKITQKSRPSAHFLPDPIEGNFDEKRN